MHQPTKIDQAKSKLVIQRQLTSQDSQDPNIIYKNINDFSVPDQLATNNKLNSNPYEQAELISSCFIEKQPTIVIRSQCQEREIPFDRYATIFGSKNQEKNADAIFTQLRVAFEIYFGPELTQQFLSQFTADIWAITSKLLTHKANDTNRDKSIICNIIKNPLYQHRIIFDKDLKQLQIHNRYKGLKFSLMGNLNCPLCNNEAKPYGCCCKNTEVNEYLHFDTEKLQFIIDQVHITNFSHKFLYYIGTFFPAENARKPLPKIIWLTKKFGNTHPLFNHEQITQKLISSFYYRDSPIGLGRTISFPSFIGKDEEIIAQKKWHVCLGLFQIKPTVIAIEAGQRTEIPFPYFKFESENDFNIILSAGPIIANDAVEFLLTYLRSIAGISFLIDKLVYAYSYNIWEATLPLLSDHKQKIEFNRCENQNNSVNSHTLIFNITTGQIDVINQYKGIRGTRVMTKCEICGANNPCECCRNLEIREHLSLPLGQGNFNIEEITLTRLTPQFSSYMDKR